MPTGRPSPDSNPRRSTGADHSVAEVVAIRTLGYTGQQALDREAPARMGISLHDLMIRAAEAVVRECLLRFHDASQPAAVFAGPGNNGGDAYAAARLLSGLGRHVVVLEGLPDRSRSPLAVIERERALEAGVPFLADCGGIPAGSLVVDGLFGAGFQVDRSLDESVSRLMRAIRALSSRGARVVAIDVPSGVESDSGRAAGDAVRADVTVTFIRPKPGLYLYPGRSHAGRIVVDTLGIPDSLVDEILKEDPPLPVVLDISAVRALRPIRPADGHKGVFGRVLVIGGSPGLCGAATLAVGAALRSGVGLVHALVPASGRAGIDARHPEALVHAAEPFPPDPHSAAGLAAGKQAVLIGPGLIPDPAAADVVEALCGLSAPLVLDAGALAVVAAEPDRFFPLLSARAVSGLAMAVLTPHPGEYLRLSPGADLSDRLDAGRALARRTGCIVALKGAGTVIAAPDGRTAINTTGNDGLSKGGSGDVLAGLLAGLLAQGMDPWDAACAAVFLHGLAAEAAAAQYGRRAMLPGDLPLFFGDAFKKSGWETA